MSKLSFKHFLTYKSVVLWYTNRYSDFTNIIWSTVVRTNTFYSLKALFDALFYIYIYLAKIISSLTTTCLRLLWNNVQYKSLASRIFLFSQTYCYFISKCLYYLFPTLNPRTAMICIRTHTHMHKTQSFLSPSLCLCLCMSVCLSLSLSVCLSVCLSISLSLSLSLYIYIYIYIPLIHTHIQWHGWKPMQFNNRVCPVIAWDLNPCSHSAF